VSDNFTPHITSPALPTDEGVVRSVKEFSDTLTLDLTDAEIKAAFEIIIKVIQKWQGIFRAKIDPNSPLSFGAVEEVMKAVDDFEDEIKTRLAESLNLLVSVDVMPVLEGTGYPTIVLEGALPSHSSAQYGMDHEKKAYEVKKAKERGEVFLGAKTLDA
jgi:hypothetical protein